MLSRTAGFGQKETFVSPRLKNDETPKMAQTAFYFLSMVAGIPIGMLVKSEFERKIFLYRSPWLPFGSSSWVGLLSSLVLKTLLGVILFLTPFILLSEAASYFCVHLGRGTYMLYMIGLASGKGLRYLYWYSKREWR